MLLTGYIIFVHWNVPLNLPRKVLHLIYIYIYNVTSKIQIVHCKFTRWLLFKQKCCNLHHLFHEQNYYGSAVIYAVYSTMAWSMTQTNIEVLVSDPLSVGLAQARPNNIPIQWIDFIYVHYNTISQYIPTDWCIIIFLQCHHNSINLISSGQQYLWIGTTTVQANNGS